MGKTIASIIVVTIALVATVAGQASAPKPGPEHKKLDYFVGKWTTTGEMKASPFGPGGKMTSTDTCDWFQGGFAVICNSQGTAPTGPTKNIGIMGYSADQKVYTYYGVDNTALTMTTVPKGTVQGDTWTFNDESMMGGQTIKSRYVLKIASPTSYSFTWEMLGTDGKWMPVLTGTSTKNK
ncbi:MAG: DUF1579 family protein [Acidobacteria bacterium]|nr:DUF1579 family protein [Acidobacteriota bacterium]